MRKITPVLAALLLALPLSGAASLVGDMERQEAPANVPVDESSSDNYRCCWVFLFGMWYCLPC